MLRYCRDARDVLLCFARDIDILFTNIKVVVLLNHENPVCVCVCVCVFRSLPVDVQNIVGLHMNPLIRSLG